jgi:aspartyl-tRNA(Asn)/glutamyl-tRNA(Gln) amidotransferase subunit A
LNAMSGRDSRDQTTIPSIPIPAEIFSEAFPVNDTSVGYYRSFMENEDLDPAMRDDFLRLIEKLKQLGLNVRELDFFDTGILVSTYYIIAMAETASNLARLDGISYGERLAAETLKEGYALTRSAHFSEETRRRIVGGNQVLSHGHSEEIYLKARGIRNQVIRNFSRDFQQVDLLVSPVSPSPPPPLGSSLEHPFEMYQSDAYTVGFSLGGLPTLTVPTGTETGIQVTAAKNREAEILKFAKYLTEEVEWN